MSKWKHLWAKLRNKIEPENEVRQPPVEVSRSERLLDAIVRSVRLLRASQQIDGHWITPLEGGAVPLAQMIFLLAFLGLEKGDVAQECARSLEEKMLSGGGWESAPGEDADLEASVAGYFALKITGRPASSDKMRRTRQRIFTLGGVVKTAGNIRFFLALLGQIPYDRTAAISPLALFSPVVGACLLRHFCASVRPILVPMAVVSALGPIRLLSPDQGIRELLTEPLPSVSTASRLIWFARSHHLTPFSRQILLRAKIWMVRHFRRSDGPGASFLAILWSWIAFRALGLDDDSPEVAACRHELEPLARHLPGGGLEISPAAPPTRDTVLAIKALRLSGCTSDDSAIIRAENWLLEHQTSEPGDWAARVNVQPGGWALQYHNEFYPNCVDTALALMVLAGAFPEGEGLRRTVIGSDDVRDRIDERPTLLRRNEAAAAGRRWLQAMQNKDASWGLFDRGKRNSFPAVGNFLPDFGSIETTASVLESLGRQGYQWHGGIRFLDRAVRRLRACQSDSGYWEGLPGTDRVRGTYQALTALIAVQVPKEDEAIIRAARWLESAQLADGGWFDDIGPNGGEEHVCSHSSPVPTAWGVMGLVAAGRSESLSVARGVQFLLDTQHDDGRWDDPAFSMTFQPSRSRLRHSGPQTYYPLMALALYAGSVGGTGE
ncbi:MAG: hypothetical protein IIZ25_02335 [Thermoguttaceae bacterium]|nr:hypothetical protein [Thermoguttaceae bacterium]